MLATLLVPIALAQPMALDLEAVELCIGRQHLLQELDTRITDYQTAIEGLADTIALKEDRLLELQGRINNATDTEATLRIQEFNDVNTQRNAEIALLQQRQATLDELIDEFNALTDDYNEACAGATYLREDVARICQANPAYGRTNWCQRLEGEGG